MDRELAPVNQTPPYVMTLAAAGRRSPGRGIDSRDELTCAARRTITNARRERASNDSRFHPRAPSDVHLIVLGMLPRAGGRRVLDAAAGDGSVSRRMTEMGFQVISADLHFAHPPEVPSPIEIDLNETLPFPDEHFDAIVSIETIEHLENPWRFMRELARVCRVGGFVIIKPKRPER